VGGLEVVLDSGGFGVRYAFELVTIGMHPEINRRSSSNDVALEL